MLAVLSAILLTSAAAAVEGSFERSLSVTGPVALDVSTGSGSITILTGAPDEVRIVGRIRARERWLLGSGEAEDIVRALEDRPPVEQVGNEIRVGRIEEEDWARRVSIS